ncbi:MAG: hypothetical protein AUJ18_01660 [Candidatus Hydrogenedentes bacterium CG1_02_42_14]|nr:MAG: hypothetical protein AUJ18_01660 [Candidatus Hydrogenedentes bacterium CG1_02_42_14]
MAQALSIEVYQYLEKKIGRDEAEKVSSVIEKGIDVIREEAKKIALEKKLEIKDELTKELASKADVLIVKNELIVEIEKVRAELRSEIESKFNSLSIKFEKLNQKFNFMIILIIIALTLMNPVVAEIIKRALNL